MTVNEIIDRVKSDREVIGRHPARLIFVRDFADYTELVAGLRLVCEEVLDIAQYGRGDILPDFKKLLKDLAAYKNQHILLLSFGEYMRICMKCEIDGINKVFSQIWEKQQDPNSTKKIIIPVFNAKELFERLPAIKSEREREFVWKVSDSENNKEYGITIFSPEVACDIGVDAANFGEWLKKWTELFAQNSQRSFTLRTRLHSYTETVYGDISVNIFSDPYSYVALIVSDGQGIKKEQASDELWKLISNHVEKGKSLEATLMHILNIGHTFDAGSVFARYGKMSMAEQEILLMLYKLYPRQDYCSYSLSMISSPADIPATLRDAIFTLTDISDDFAEERASVLREMQVDYGKDYFAKLDKISSLDARLKILTCKEQGERAYAIKLLSEHLRANGDLGKVETLLKARYSDAWQYIQPTYVLLGEVGTYFDWYRRAKIINRPNTDFPCNIEYGDINSRYKELQKHHSESCKLVWIDGLGVEWLPLLMCKLKDAVKANNIESNIKSNIAKSRLPSETDFNRDWTDADEKLGAFDKLSHIGMPDDKDYFSCISAQIEMIGKIANKAVGFLKDFNRVIVTSDHGSSRLAALSFHDVTNFSMDPPENAMVGAFGRYAKLDGDTYFSPNEFVELVENDKGRFAIVKAYKRYKKSGNVAGGNTDETPVAGEVHGGMTPEEYLVPVIVISRNEPLQKKDKTGKSKGIAASKLGLP